MHSCNRFPSGEKQIVTLVPLQSNTLQFLSESVDLAGFIVNTSKLKYDVLGSSRLYFQSATSKPHE